MGVAILITYKVDFRTWAITKNEEDHLKMIKEWINPKGKKLLTFMHIIIELQKSIKQRTARRN